MAVLTKSAIISAINVVRIQSDGTTTPISGGILCNSSDSSVIQVTTGCTAVMLNGSETRFSDRVNVFVSYGFLWTVLPLRVWYPDFPLMWAISDPVLNAVQGWIGSSVQGCKQQYQTSDVTVQALFRSNVTNSVLIDVTSKVASMLQTSNSSVAMIGAISGSVVGVSTGSVLVSISSDVSGLLGSVNVEVSNIPVSVVTLVVTPVASITLSGVPSSLSSHSSVTVVAAIGQQLGTGRGQVLDLLPGGWGRTEGGP